MAWYKGNKTISFDNVSADNEIFYLHTHNNIIRIMSYICDTQGIELKLNRKGEISDKKLFNLLDDWIGKIGIDNMYRCINILQGHKITCKALENEFNNILIK